MNKILLNTISSFKTTIHVDKMLIPNTSKRRVMWLLFYSSAPIAAIGLVSHTLVFPLIGLYCLLVSLQIWVSQASKYILNNEQSKSKES